MEIDLVYLWVDGSDPVWRARKMAFTGAPPDKPSEQNCKGRWADNDELRYSLRSVEKFAPWIRRIFIVTDGQIPAWLDTSNPRVCLIDQNDILPPEARPCYNSAVIEYFLHRIPGLAEHFLYANDDMFVGAPVEPGDFFTPDGRPIVRLIPKRLGRLRCAIKGWLGKDIGYYRRTVCHASNEVGRITGRYFSSIPHHNIDAYRLSDNRLAAEEVFVDLLAAMLPHHTRTDGDLQRAALSYWALATGRASKRLVADKSESVYVHAHRDDCGEVIARHTPRLFCINDNQHTSDDNRKRIRPLLESLFPHRSEFEKTTESGTLERDTPQRVPHGDRQHGPAMA
jgi:hypothetical protein